MDTTFGEKLKRERRKQNITQSQLGATQFSPSYVSLIESDRRPPSEQFLRRVAEVFGLPVETVRTWSIDGQHSKQVDLAELVTNAHRAQAAGDLPEAARTSDAAASLARQAGDTGTWWSMTSLAADLWRLQGQFDTARERLIQLTQSPIYRQSPALITSTHARLSVVERFLGSIDAAVEQAALAVAQIEQAKQPTDIGSAEALMAQLAALTQASRHDQLEPVVTQLRPLLDDESQPPSLRGQVAWALGNVSYAQGNNEDGAVLHDRAKEFLRPEHDLKLWTQFHWAAAAMRLRHGLADAATRKFIDDGEQAAKLLGEGWVDSMPRRILDVRWKSQTGEHSDVIRAVLPLLEESSQDLVGTEAAELRLLLAEALVATNDLDAAGQHLVQAARWYAEAGMAEQAAAVLAQFPLQGHNKRTQSGQEPKRPAA